MKEAARQILLAQVKNSLDITWEDDGTDEKVLNWIDSGAAYLDGKRGEAGDYLATGLPRTLLFEYARYARDAALDVFENNYQSLILAMQNGRKVDAYELEEAAAAES